MGLRSVQVALALVLALWAGQAMAQSSSGVVLAVVQSANIDGNTGKKILEPEAPVFAGDRIDTGPVGEAQIRFRDNTKLVVGPNSSMVIDAFVFNDNDTAREISINVVKGAFRFITGNSKKDAYNITTPTATIGVRGTEFDVSVEGAGITRVANFEGTTRICPRSANRVFDPAKGCVEVDEPCSLSVIRTPNDEVTRYSNRDIEFRNRQLKYYFRYIRNQEHLLQDFKVNLAQCQLAEVIIPGGPTNNTPGNNTPPGGFTPPGEPVFTPPYIPPPTPPSLDDRHDDRPDYNHGDPFR
jgi:hypothetical protein